jgi:hypothetical protein
MNYLKAEGETQLRPAMRRLVIWGMASPLISVVLGTLVVAFGKFDGQSLPVALPFGCFSIAGGLSVVLWGLRELPNAKREPTLFLNLFKIMILLNVSFLVYSVGGSTLAVIALDNDY